MTYIASGEPFTMVDIYSQYLVCFIHPFINPRNMWVPCFTDIYHDINFSRTQLLPGSDQEGRKAVKLIHHNSAEVLCSEYKWIAMMA